MWSQLITTGEVQSQDLQFIGLLAVGLFLLYSSFTARERLMGLISTALGMVTWWALAGWWLVMETQIPALAWLYFGVGMSCLLLLLYGVWGYIIDKKGIFSGPN